MYYHIDLFSGIGGFSQGLKKAGFPILKTYFSEIDKYAISVYRRNFPDAEYIGGVESVQGSRFKGRKTIITFGFPCQDLSVAGKRRGFDGSRSSLFFEAMRIIKEVQPDIFIFENVRGFYSSNDGKDFQIALQTIADIGIYECEWQLLNTAWFLPQNRERIYFIGHLAGRSGKKVFPIRENYFRIKQRNNKTSRVRSLTAGGNSGGLHSNMTLLRWQNQHTGMVEDKQSPALRANMSRSGCKNMPVIVAQRGRESGQELEERKDGLTNSLTSVQKDNYVIDLKTASGTSKTRKGGISFGKAQTLDHNCYLGVKEKQSVRRLTPTECERLQGFPEIQKCVIIEICKENQKKNVNVEKSNHKLQKSVGSVEKEDFQENVLYAVKSLNIKDQHIKKHVQKNVLINLGESRVEILNQGKSLLNVSFAEAQKKLALHTKIENIALLIVSINTILEKITQTGKVEFHQNEQVLMDQKNGNCCVTKSGKEIMQLAKNVKKNSITLNHYFKSIISNHLDIKDIGLMSKILFYFVDLVIGKYIKKENKISILLTHSYGWTKYGHEDQIISDSQRYKMLGNAVSVPVVKAIGEKLF